MGRLRFYLKMMFKPHGPDISPLVWLILPIVSYVLLYGVLLTGFPPPVARAFGSEQGLLENAQVLFLLLFLGLGGNILYARAPLPHPWLRLRREGDLGSGFIVDEGG